MSQSSIKSNYKVSKMATTPDNKNGDKEEGDKELADMVTKLESKDYRVLNKDEYDAIIAVRPKTSIIQAPSPNPVLQVHWVVDYP